MWLSYGMQGFSYHLTCKLIPLLGLVFSRRASMIESHTEAYVIAKKSWFIYFMVVQMSSITPVPAPVSSYFSYHNSNDKLLSLTFNRTWQPIYYGVLLIWKSILWNSRLIRLRMRRKDRILWCLSIYFGESFGWIIPLWWSHTEWT